MSFRIGSTVRATCGECGFTGSPWELELHSCDIQQFGGRCEDYPCCGHTDGDGCQTRPEHTSAYWTQVAYESPWLMHEPGSPEYYDAMNDYGDRYDGDEIWFDSQEECEGEGYHGDSWSGTDTPGVGKCEYCGGAVAYDDDEE